MFNYSRYQADTPTDVKDSSVLSLVLFKQSTLETIVNKCLPFAKGSEFQVHYRSIIVRLKNETNELIITVPTAFFNFQQTVSTGSVNFETANEGTAARRALVPSQALMPDLLSEFPALQALKTYADHNGFDYSIIESNSGSIHRHPGDFTFSSIDRDKSPNEPGVIYRHLNASDAVKTDSVIYIAANKLAKIVTTETRIVNVQESTNGITGTYTEVPTITCILQDAEVTTAADSLVSLLGDPEVTEEQPSFKFVRASGATTKEYPLITEILNQFAATTEASSPDTAFVIGSHIEERSFWPKSKSVYTPKKTTGIRIWDKELGQLVPAVYDPVTITYIKESPKTIAKTDEELIADYYKSDNFLRR